MRREVILLVLLGACFDPPPPADGPYIESHVETKDIPQYRPPALDMLLVVDNTSAMSPYAARSPELAAEAASALESVGFGFADIQVAVTTNGGSLSPVLSDQVDWFGVHTSSFEGSLADNLAPLVNVGTSAPGPSQPLDAMHRALGSAGFLRDNAYLAVVTVAASDDASPSFDYVQFLKGVKSDPAAVIVLGIYPQPSANLDAFHQAFPNRGSTVSIDTASYADAFTLIEQLSRFGGGIPCFEGSLLDTDPETLGLQPDCNVSAWDDGTELAQVPPCQGAAPAVGSCWEIRTEPECIESDLEFHVRGTWTLYHPEIRVECATSP